MVEVVVLTVFCGPMAVWWGLSLYHAWVGNTFKHSIHATSTTSTAFHDAKRGWIKEMAEETAKKGREGG